MRNLKEYLRDRRLAKVVAKAERGLRRQPAIGLLPTDTCPEVKFTELEQLSEMFGPERVVVSLPVFRNEDKNSALVYWIIVGRNAAAVWTVHCIALRQIYRGVGDSEENLAFYLAAVAASEVVRRQMTADYGIQLPPFALGVDNGST